MFEKQQAQKYVNFKVYTPSYIPSGYNNVSYFLGNPSEPTHPQLEIDLKRSENNQIDVYEFLSKMFNPPDYCGQESAEFESRYDIRVPCKLVTVTPKGTQIYTDNVTDYFLLGGTKITFPVNYIDEDKIVQFVDSFVETPLSKIHYRSY